MFLSLTSFPVVGYVVDADEAEVITPAEKRSKEKKKTATSILRSSRNAKHGLKRGSTDVAGYSRSSVYRYADKSAAGRWKKRVFSVEFKRRTVEEYTLIPSGKAKKRYLFEKDLKPCLVSKWKKQMVLTADPHPCGICSSTNVGSKFYTCDNTGCSVFHCCTCVFKLFVRQDKDPPEPIPCPACRADIGSFKSTLSQVPVEVLKELFFSTRDNIKAEIE